MAAEIRSVEGDQIYRDRERLWHRFTHAVTWAAAATAIVLILMAIFLL